MRHVVVTLFFAILFLIHSLCTVTQAWAENWKTNVKDLFLPSYVVAVDKERQKFFFFEKKSPLKLKYEFPCTTGQRHGDKQVINDLKTPEGIYFVEYKIANGLDFREYGGVAYTLNYPNPVDRLRGKTGHGIWIHSKGFGLVPTKGCVAIGLQEIDTVGPLLAPGTAVIVAESMSTPNIFSHEEKVQAQHLRNLMQAWSHAWEMRSKKMFDFYDEESYSKATEDFQAFRANKERIFSMVNSIKLFNRDIHVLEGPGYWVTWAEQCYTASNHTSEGIRRLYWQRDNDKGYRIVGMEWLPRDVGMLAEYKKGKLIAQASQTITNDASEAATITALNMPEDAPDQIVPKAERQVVALNDTPLPASTDHPLSEFNWTNPENVEKKTFSNPQTLAQNDVPQGISAEEEKKNAVITQSKQFFSLLTKRDSAWKDVFSQAHFNRLPWVYKQRTLKRTLFELESVVTNPQDEILSQFDRYEENKNGALTYHKVLLIDQNNPFEGEYRCYWQLENDEWKLVGLNILPKPTDLYAHWLESITVQVNRDIETWRKAWETASLDSYIDCYTEKALQQGRRGRANIRRQKELLWSQVKPAQVLLTGLRIMPTRKGVQADMTQTYTDSTGKKDQGLKILLLERDGDHWKIAQEDWQALSNAVR